MIRAAGEEIERIEEPLMEAIREGETPSAGTRVLAMGLDGANVRLAEPGARKGRPGERPGKETPKETTSAYRNAMVASFTCYGEVAKGEKTPRRLQTRYVARMPEPGAASFKRRVEAEWDAWKRKLGSDVVTICLCDAHRAIWNYIDKDPRFEGSLKLVDFYHAAEHLSLAAEALFGKNSVAGTAWYETWKARLLGEDGAAKRLLRAMGNEARRRQLSTARRRALASHRTFFRRNGKRMTYAEFRRRGYPIGSGPTEAACKTLVKERLCRSGMRWTRSGGQHVLRLRTLQKSGRWDAFWAAFQSMRKTDDRAA